MNLPFSLMRRIECIAEHAAEKYYHDTAIVKSAWVVAVNLMHVLSSPVSAEPLPEHKEALRDALQTQMRTTGQLMDFNDFDEARTMAVLPSWALPDPLDEIQP